MNIVSLFDGISCGQREGRCGDTLVYRPSIGVLFVKKLKECEKKLKYPKEKLKKLRRKSSSVKGNILRDPDMREEYERHFPMDFFGR